MQIRSVAVMVALGLVPSSVFAQQAVQWRAQDGGNGHWYQVKIGSTGLSWNSAREMAIAAGGYLATATSLPESDFLFTCASVESAWTQNRYVGPWLGGRQDTQSPSFAEPAGGWVWDNGETWSFTNWDSSNPSNGPSGSEDFLHLSNYSGQWNDVRVDGEGNVVSFLVEWSADCNNDGVVDYGQILRGELADADGNGVPDACELDPCPGDINDSGVVNGTDIAIILGAWGTSGGKFPRADTDGNAIVDAADLAVVLGGWGPCPN